MNKVKIVRKYVSKSEITKIIAYQKRLARADNRLVLKVEAVDACDFFKANKVAASRLFKDWAYPQVGEYIVIVYYNMEACAKFDKNESRVLKNRIKRVIKEGATDKNRIRRAFFIVNLEMKERMKVTELTFDFVTTYSIPAWMFRYYTTPTNKKPSRFEIPRSTSKYRFAA